MCGEGRQGKILAKIDGVIDKRCYRWYVIGEMSLMGCRWRYVADEMPLMGCRWRYVVDEMSLVRCHLLDVIGYIFLTRCDDDTVQQMPGEVWPYTMVVTVIGEEWRIAASSERTTGLRMNADSILRFMNCRAIGRMHAWSPVNLSAGYFLTTNACRRYELFVWIATKRKYTKGEWKIIIYYRALCIYEVFTTNSILRIN